MICIIDDDEGTRDSLQLLLECEGFAAHGFASCREFLTQHRLAATDALIIDVHLPEMSGLELLEHLRRDGSRVAAIIMTGRPTAAIRARAAAAGAFAFVEKPYPAADLLGLVRAMTAPKVC
jgi:FixJ family two-component response regulator